MLKSIPTTLIINNCVNGFSSTCHAITVYVFHELCSLNHLVWWTRIRMKCSPLFTVLFIGLNQATCQEFSFGSCPDFPVARNFDLQRVIIMRENAYSFY